MDEGDFSDFCPLARRAQPSMKRKKSNERRAIGLMMFIGLGPAAEVEGVNCPHPRCEATSRFPGAFQLRLSCPCGSAAILAGSLPSRSWDSGEQPFPGDRKSTRLNSSHLGISY